MLYLVQMVLSYSVWQEHYTVPPRLCDVMQNFIVLLAKLTL